MEDRSREWKTPGTGHLDDKSTEQLIESEYCSVNLKKLNVLHLQSIEKGSEDICLSVFKLI